MFQSQATYFDITSWKSMYYRRTKGEKRLQFIACMNIENLMAILRKELSIAGVLSRKKNEVHLFLTDPTHRE